jgi:hypothetical protein
VAVSLSARDPRLPQHPAVLGIMSARWRSAMRPPESRVLRSRTSNKVWSQEKFPTLLRATAQRTTISFVASTAATRRCRSH